jgi:hypothetical protein
MMSTESGRFKKQLVPKIPERLLMCPIKAIVIGISTHDVLHLQSSLQDIADVVEGYDTSAAQRQGIAETPYEVPVLESLQNKVIVGSVKVSELRRILILSLKQGLQSNSCQKVHT